MSTARAAEGDDQLTASPLAVVRDCTTKGALDVVQQLLRGRLLDHKCTDTRVATIERPQVLHPIRVVEKPYVHHPRRAIGDSLLVTEGQAGDEHPLPGAQR